MNDIERYYHAQAGGGGFPYYVGQYQRGHGIGSIFSSLFRTAVPFLTRGLKAGGKAIGKAVLRKVVGKISGESSARRRKAPPRGGYTAKRRRVVSKKINSKPLYSVI